MNFRKTATVAIASTVTAFGLPGGASAVTLSGIEINPLIVAGDPNGTPPDSPDNRIIPNTTDSVFAGVGSLSLFAPGEGTFLCSGSPISSIHILTAAHCLDVIDNGNNFVDLLPENVTFNLNFGGDLTSQISATALDVFPEFQGFENTLNNDLAIVTLSQAVPEGVPIYPLLRSPLRPRSFIGMVGYGTTGNGITGFEENSADFTIKRLGFNETEDLSSLAGLGDIGGGLLPADLEEIFLFDFDRINPDGTDDTTGFDLVLGSGDSVGNTLEATIGPGDSGGPSFISAATGLPLLAGVNTFGFAFPGFLGLPGTVQGTFGTGAGGVVVSEPTKLAWIDTFLAQVDNPGDDPGDIPDMPGDDDNARVPEPSAVFGAIAVGAALLLKRRR